MSQPFFVLCLAPALPPDIEPGKEADFKLVPCPTMEKFREALNQVNADLVLSDFSLPGLSLQNVQTILKEENFDLPLIAIPAQVTDEIRTKFMMEGASDCIAPDQIQHLKRAIERELKNLRLDREWKDKRREAVRFVAARLAHDFNNILAPVSMSAPMLRWDLEDAEYEDILDTLEQTTRVGAETIQHLLLFGRGTDLERSDVFLSCWIKKTALDFGKTLPPNISLVFEIEEDLPVLFADPERLKQALTAILENAREAMPEGGSIRIKGGKTIDPEGFFITIADEGIGMDAATLEQIFDPFFSTKRNVRKGAGLGLCLALGILKSHRGDIAAQSRPSKGSTFQLTLPARKA